MEVAAGWSGWPGAYCLTCGRGDPWEQATADGNYDLLGNGSTEAPEPTWKPGTVKLYDFNCGLRGAKS